MGSPRASFLFVGDVDAAVWSGIVACVARRDTEHAELDRALPYFAVDNVDKQRLLFVGVWVGDKYARMLGCGCVMWDVASVSHPVVDVVTSEVCGGRRRF